MGNYVGASDAWATLGSATLEEVPSLDSTKPNMAGISLTNNNFNQTGNAWLTTPFARGALGGGFSQTMAFSANSPNPAGTNGGQGIGVIIAPGRGSPGQAVPLYPNLGGMSIRPLSNLKMPQCQTHTKLSMQQTVMEELQVIVWQFTQTEIAHKLPSAQSKNPEDSETKMFGRGWITIQMVH